MKSLAQIFFYFRKKPSPYLVEKTHPNSEIEAAQESIEQHFKGLAEEFDATPLVINPSALPKNNPRLNRKPKK